MHNKTTDARCDNIQAAISEVEAVLCLCAVLAAAEEAPRALPWWTSGTKSCPAPTATESSSRSAVVQAAAWNGAAVHDMRCHAGEVCLARQLLQGLVGQGISFKQSPAVLFQSLLLQCGDEGSVLYGDPQTCTKLPACLGYTKAGACASRMCMGTRSQAWCLLEMRSQKVLQLGTRGAEGSAGRPLSRPPGQEAPREPGGGRRE